MAESGANEGQPGSVYQSTIIDQALSSAMAGIITRLCTYPLDTIKAQLQAPESRHGTIRELWRQSSWRSLYRGLSVALVGGTPGTILYLTTYEQLKKGGDGGDVNGTTGISNITNSFTTYFFAGLAAEAVACTIYVPVDVVKERLQVGMYQTPTEALLTIFRAKDDGRSPLRTLYRGYWATLASFGPYSAFYFLFYEESKRLVRETHQSQQQQPKQQHQLSFWWILACSAGSGAAASFITSPLDLVKLRIQLRNSEADHSLSVSGGGGGRRRREGGTGMLHELLHVYRSAGLRGLFRGAGARVLHFVPATTIAMTTYETCLRTIADRHP